MPRVVVLGSSGFDLTLRLARLPRPGETLLGGALHTAPGGKGANQAIAARRAGADVTFITAFGDDDFGRQIASHDRAEGLDLSHAVTAHGSANQVALILVGEGGQNLIGVAPEASLHLTPEHIDKLPASVFGPSAVLLASLEVPRATVCRALDRAHAAGMTSILNPAPAPTDPDAGQTLCTRLDFLTPNQEELHVMTGEPVGSIDEITRAARQVCGWGVGCVVVTIGEAGCVIVTADGANLVTGFVVPTVDTVGAGDAFSGALAVALAEGRPLVEAATRACAAGAIAVTRPGAQGALPSRGEIDQLLADGARRG